MNPIQIKAGRFVDLRTKSSIENPPLTPIRTYQKDKKLFNPNWMDTIKSEVSTVQQLQKI